MKEIGGYFQLENLIGHEYHTSAIRINTGRNALLYLCLAKGIKKVFLPYFLCDSVSNCLALNEIDFEFYHVNDKFEPVFDVQLNATEYLYIVNYYGIFDNKILSKFIDKYVNVIVDNTHSFFQKSIPNVDTIYSCRKFFGVPDGAYLYTNSSELVLKKDTSVTRMNHVLGRYEGTASEYYSDFIENDNTFNKLPLLSMSRLTRNLLTGIDYENTVDARNENFKILFSQLDGLNLMSGKEYFAPYCYPFLVENGKELRQKLIQNKIYIAKLWPNVSYEFGANKLECDISDNLLPIPCDQRYSQADMERIIKIVKEYYEI